MEKYWAIENENVNESSNRIAIPYWNEWMTNKNATSTLMFGHAYEVPVPPL